MSTGSLTAKNGFENEDDIVTKFNSWENDADACNWLETMGYKIDDIESVNAIKLDKHTKTDVQVQISIKIKLKKAIGIENIQIKLVSGERGFNQIDKRWLSHYKSLWRIPEDVFKTLQYYCGELEPYISSPRDRRRMFIDEFSEDERNGLIHFFEKNKFLVISDILRGRGAFAAEWILVVHKFKSIRWLLISINEAVNCYGNEPILVTQQGNIKIGRIGMQRKGGDKGAATANMLQFKLDPVDLFDVV